MATPALRALREGLPGARITYVARPTVSRLLGGLAWHDALTLEKGPSWIPQPGLRRGGFDAALLLPASFGSAWAAWAAGIPRRIGVEAQGRGWLLTDPIKRPAPDYTGRTYARLAAVLGCAPRNLRLELATTPEEETRAGAWWKDLALEGKRVAGLLPGAAFGSSKCWPPAHFSELARRLRSELGLEALVLHGPGEARVAQAVREGSGGVARVADPDLGTLKAMIRRLDLAVTNDSGPRHMAEALGIPTVSLLGPVDPRYSDSGNPRVRALREPVDCSPCGLKVCPIDHRCLVRILPERVLREVRSLLG